MRDYIFHGKRVDNGEWVEGYYVYDESGQTTEEPTAYIIHLNIHPCGWSLIPYKVIPETVGEFTGIYDINQRKIFENDIVRTQPFTDRPYSSRAKSKQHIGVVEYCMPELRGDHFKQHVYDAKWRVNVKDYGKYVCSNWSDFFNCEVIGTVYENADLLDDHNH